MYWNSTSARDSAAISGSTGMIRSASRATSSTRSCGASKSPLPTRCCASRKCRCVVASVRENDRLLAVGNPTRPLGPFFASQRPGSPWTKVAISVFEHPNVVERRQVIAGGPEYAWLERIRAEEGEGSQFWAGRILAEFPTESSEALFTRALLDAAVARPVTPNGGAAPA